MSDSTARCAVTITTMGAWAIYHYLRVTLTVARNRREREGGGGAFWYLNVQRANTTGVVLAQRRKEPAGEANSNEPSVCSCNLSRHLVVVGQPGEEQSAGNPQNQRSSQSPTSHRTTKLVVSLSLVRTRASISEARTHDVDIAVEHEPATPGIGSAIDAPHAG